MTLLRRVYQKPDASWGEMDRPIGAKAAREWEKWECFSKGLYVPGPRDWTPESLLLPQTSDEFPQASPQAKAGRQAGSKQAGIADKQAYRVPPGEPVTRSQAAPPR
jgi:hypothetical protein